MAVSPADSFEVMSRMASLLRALLDGLPVELLAVRDEEGWGQSDIVAHLVVIEPVALVDRLCRILSDDRPAVPDVDEQANLEDSGLRGHPLPTLLEQFAR